MEDAGEVRCGLLQRRDARRRSDLTLAPSAHTCMGRRGTVRPGRSRRRSGDHAGLAAPRRALLCAPGVALSAGTEHRAHKTEHRAQSTGVAAGAPAPVGPVRLGFAVHHMLMPAASGRVTRMGAYVVCMAVRRLTRMGGYRRGGRRRCAAGGCAAACAWSSSPTGPRTPKPRRPLAPTPTGRLTMLRARGHVMNSDGGGA
jgi:hypothetical protein